jgi:predicted dehydrogenase
MPLPARPRAQFSHEHPRRLRSALVGCGGQAQRNLLPALRFAPVDLVAVCDVDEAGATEVARGHGVAAVYGDLTDMLAAGGLDVVFFASGYDGAGEPRYPAQAIAALEAGCHAWIEKPPAARTSDVEAMWEASLRTDRKVGVGFMRMFAPAIDKARKLIGTKAFGALTSLYVRDPEQLPPPQSRESMIALKWLLDHVVHPASVLVLLGGTMRRITVEAASNGASIVLIKFASGAVATLHQPWGQSCTCPTSRLEMVGEGANFVVENEIRARLYRRVHDAGQVPVYGRTSDFLTADEAAPLSWEMNAYSGEPANMHVFYQGYAPCIGHFCTSVLENRPLERSGLGHAWHVVRFFEVLVASRPGEPAILSDPPEWTLAETRP